MKSSLTGNDNYLENFHPGAIHRHARGKTVTELENVQITNMVMNTAQSHFNEDIMTRDPRKHRLVYGGVTASIAIGLAAEDTAENALAELSMDKIRFPASVFHGDTIYAFTEVLAVEDSPDRPDAGIVTFRHWGVNQNQIVVFEGERRVLIKRGSHWQDK
ncbi:MaoC family dehydratase [Chelativorans alearense]|uniref:MaoC family dehydratase n=1 Tax=Chelativorans alearense TaxID=2681495 RepID=UPI0013D2375C|nr:MaoC family dehydratase [Chelativorans alearense]